LHTEKEKVESRSTVPRPIMSSVEDKVSSIPKMRARIVSGDPLRLEQKPLGLDGNYVAHCVILDIIE
jgi:hypothetical protein